MRGAVPKFGLAYAGVAGALAIGQLLIEIYRGSSSTSRPGVEVLAGERVLTSGVEVGPGWVLGVVALALTVLAGRRRRRRLGPHGHGGRRRRSTRSGRRWPAPPSCSASATVLCLALPAADVPDQLVTDPATGLETVVTREGPQALLERPGLALLGGLLLAGAVVLCSVVAPSLRPRLAAVGGLLAIAVAVLARRADRPARRRRLRRPGVDRSPGAGLLLTGLGYAVLTALAWRLPSQPCP